MQQIKIERTDKPDLKFTGELIKWVSDDESNSTRWTELYLYKTKNTEMVAHKVECTRWQGERNYYSAKKCECETDIIHFFEYGWLAKELYEKCGIDHYLNLD